MMSGMSDPFGARTALPGHPGIDFFRIARLDEAGVADTSRLPYTVRVLLEMALRGAGSIHVTEDDVCALANWPAPPPDTASVAFSPARVILQDFTGVPAVVDLAAMRSAMARAGRDPAGVDPLEPADLVIDHSVQVDSFGTRFAYARNIEREYERNGERYALLRWAQGAFRASAWCRPVWASSTRSTSSTWAASCRSATASRCPTRWSAPTPTRP
jgi:aconitate hydratase